VQLGEIAEGAGRSVEAAAHYRRVLELLRTPDAEYRPFADEARARLAALAAH
jgi:hypothetical protein